MAAVQAAGPLPMMMTFSGTVSFSIGETDMRNRIENKKFYSPGFLRQSGLL
jgi:hypothetical protein